MGYAPCCQPPKGVPGDTYLVSRRLFGRHFGDQEGVGEDEVEDSPPRNVAPDPGAPTQEEIDEHNIDHVPFRCWCEHCVRGRGLGEQHRAGPCSAVAIVAFDYLFITRGGVKTRKELGGAEILLKILVVKDSKGKSIWAYIYSISLRLLDSRYSGLKQFFLKNSS